MSDLRSFGHLAQVSAALGTQYGRELRQRMDETEPRRMHNQRHRLFGEPRSKPRTIIEAVPHPPVRDVWHDSSRWRLITSGCWQFTKEHINGKEGRVLLMGLRRWARSLDNMGKLVFSLGDNLVTVLSFEKGRSSSSMLNNLCRRACGYVFGCRFNWRIRHIRTQYNAADAPSRVFDPGGKMRVTHGEDGGSGVLGRHVTAHSFEQGSIFLL